VCSTKDYGSLWLGLVLPPASYCSGSFYKGFQFVHPKKKTKNGKFQFLECESPLKGATTSKGSQW
jgi:hypothetical protein